jgi:hypothetical protein
MGIAAAAMARSWWKVVLRVSGGPRLRRDICQAITDLALELKAPITSKSSIR